MKTKTKAFFLALLSLLMLSSLMHFVRALPTGPSITYVSNTTAASLITNRSQDTKGTITTITLSAIQQDYKWKAYVGNVSGKLALADASGKSIYDWSLGTISGGKVFVTRSNSVSWANVACVNQATIDSEEAAFGTTSSLADSINLTFKYTAHKNFLVGTVNITNSSCRSTATYINGAPQTVNEAAAFEEVLLRDTTTSSLIYTTLIEAQHPGYDGVNNYDFQLLVAENESATAPLTYYFYVELG